MNEHYTAKAINVEYQQAIAASEQFGMYLPKRRSIRNTVTVLMRRRSHVTWNTTQATPRTTAVSAAPSA